MGSGQTMAQEPIQPIARAKNDSSIFKALLKIKIKRNDINYVTCKAPNIYYLALYRKGVMGNISGNPAASSVIHTVIIPILQVKKLRL